MKKTIAILFSLLLVCGLSIMALADAAEDPVLEPEVMIQAEISHPAEPEQTNDDPGEPCPLCESGTVRQTDVLRGEWRTYSLDFCSHANYEGPVDLLQKRTVTYVYECDSCPYPYPYAYEVMIGYDYGVYCQQKEHLYITTLLPEN